jgi:hypothetical protein
MSTMDLNNSPIVRLKQGQLIDQRDPSRRLRGLCKLLRHTFYPDYRYERNPGSHGGRSPGAGRAWGRAVDRALSRYVATPASSRARVRASMNEDARRIVSLLESHGYDLAYAQVGCAAPGTNICTFADLVCRYGTRLVPVEIKACAAHYYDRGTGRLRAPFGVHSNAPRNQHQLQLAVTTELLRSTFPTHAWADGALVVRVDADGLQTLPLQPWAAKAARAMVEKMHAQRFHPWKRRTTKKKVAITSTARATRSRRQ